MSGFNDVLLMHLKTIRSITQGYLTFGERINMKTSL